MSDVFNAYADILNRSFLSTRVSTREGAVMPMDDALKKTHDMLITITRGHNKLMFVGNGGSAGIAGHSAIDFAKNGGVRSMTFNDASSLTCLGNDLGYDQVFAKQVEMQGLPGDVLVAISSSGQSPNILNAVTAARAVGCAVITLSGFKPGNALRQMGDINFYIEAEAYGFVEVTHQAILHVILDTAMGWTKASGAVQPTRKVG
ncbi:MAG: SIS domain-containing protein [Rhodospirillaceae bacterium]|nr:SIS domain-containing protein [Rhodospirillaceae bacterium]